jgi:K+-transporting ATPase KdpF subunit
VTPAQHFDQILGLVLTLAGFAYLIYSMLRPEKF